MSSHVRAEEACGVAKRRETVGERERAVPGRAHVFGFLARCAHVYCSIFLADARRFATMLSAA